MKPLLQKNPTEPVRVGEGVGGLPCRAAPAGDSGSHCADVSLDTPIKGEEGTDVKLRGEERGRALEAGGNGGQSWALLHDQGPTEIDAGRSRGQQRTF